MSVPEPSKILTPWAASGLKNAIPATANPVTGNAGYDQGFPAINMTPKEAGGRPPFGQDFNGILFAVTEALRYMQAGGTPTYSAALSTAIGGYPKGAILLGSDGLTLWQNQIDGNTNDPNAAPTNWIATVSGSNPIGAPIPWPLSTPPSGFMLVNGQAFNPVTYPKLALAYPSGTLPDLRGEFIRGWDNGRGVDAGRVLLSAQGDAIRNITGTFASSATNTDNINMSSGAFFRHTGDAGGATPIGSGDIADRMGFDASRVVPTATDNRPRNVAFNYIVRAA